MVLNKKQIVAVVLFLVIAGNVYSQSGTYLKNLWGKSVGEIVVVKDDATVLDSVLFDQYNRHIYNIVQTIKQFGYDATSFASLAAAIDTAAADTAMVIVASRQSIAETAPDTLPKTASLFVRQGGRIKITRKFRIEGHFIDPGPIQVFEGNLDSVEFAPGSVDYVRPEWFGANVDDGNVYTSEFKYAMNSMAMGGTIHIRMILQSGVYKIDSLIIDNSYNSNRYEIEGNGIGNTFLEIQGVSSNGIQINGRIIKIKGLTVSSSSSRQSSTTGWGIYAKASFDTTTTQGRIWLHEVEVVNQPNGIYLYKPELVEIKRSWIDNINGIGIYINGVSGDRGISNLIEDTRISNCDSTGLYTYNTGPVTYINLQVLNCQKDDNGGPQIWIRNGFGAIFINPDIEGNDQVSAIKMSGSYHKIFGANFFLNKIAVELSSASYCYIAPFKASNSGGNTGTAAVSIDGYSQYNTVYISGSYTNYSSSLTLSNTNNFIFTDGELKVGGFLSNLTKILFSGYTDRGIFFGTGSPEGVLTAGVGSMYLRTDGGAGTTLYVKESGTGNTGWTAK